MKPSTIHHYFLILTVIFQFSFLISGYTNDRTKAILSKGFKEGTDKKASSQFYTGPGMLIEGSKKLNKVFIGPEVPITGLTGFYDWQTNGDCKRQLYYGNENFVHAIYTLSQDSTQINSSRRTFYAFSPSGGSGWGSEISVPFNTRSGYGYLTIGAATFGPDAVIINHYGTPLKTYIHTDAFPGLGSFSTVASNSLRNYIYPSANKMSNGNILVTGLSATTIDTMITQIFNPAITSWIAPPQNFHSNTTNYYSMRIAAATGPSGKAVIVISPVLDIGGSFGKNRIFYFTTEDNGTSWSGPQLLFDTHIDTDGDTSRPWVGLDAVYDNAGNFFAAFNTISTKEDYSSAKIWLNKNGIQNKIIVRNTEIPGAMTTSAGLPMHDVCSMDWPSISLSEHNDAVFCAYSVAKQNDIVNGFNSMDIHISYANAGNLDPSPQTQVTSGTNDERFVSLNRVTFGSLFRKIHAVYQKDPQPGTSAPDIGDFAPVSRASLVYRNIELIVGLLNGVHSSGEFLSNTYSLHQNYPNPFNPATNIKFEIPKSGNVRINVYDIAGKLVSELLNKNLSPGTYETQWDGSGSSSGVYFYSLESEGFKETRKMLLIK